MKRFLCAFALIVLLAAPAWTEELRTAPANPDYVAFEVKAKTGLATSPFTLRPAPIDLRHVGEVRFAGARSATLPAAYDLRTENRVTPVRNQNPYGTCWTFAAMGSAESGLMPSEASDFSEWNLAWFAYKDTPGFTVYSSGSVYNLGGNDWMAVATLARRRGIVAESACAYGGADPSGSYSNVKHLQEALYLGSSFSATTIKDAVTRFGGVSVSFAWSDANYNSSTAAFYCSTTTTPNHAVLLVGWDDSYPATNFRTRPAGNGAWIIKNSWGTGWGKSGYFYLSYYDKSLKDGVAYRTESATNFTGIYQYDPLGWTSSSGYGSTSAWMANVFAATRAERLEAVAIYAAAAGTTYQLSVYGDVSGAPTSGRLLYGPQSGTLDAPGYRTIRLSSAVSLAQGQKFAVVLKLTTPGYNYPVPVESPYSGYSDAASAAAGQSYTSSNGTTWSDLGSDGRRNVCLKAFTNAAGVVPTLTPTPSVRPTATPTPTVRPTAVPTVWPSVTPTRTPTPVPSVQREIMTPQNILYSSEVTSILSDANAKSVILGELSRLSGKTVTSARVTLFAGYERRFTVSRTDGAVQTSYGVGSSQYGSSFVFLLLSKNRSGQWEKVESRIWNVSSFNFTAATANDAACDSEVGVMYGGLPTVRFKHVFVKAQILSTSTYLTGSATLVGGTPTDEEARLSGQEGDKGGGCDLGLTGASPLLLLPALLLLRRR